MQLHSRPETDMSEVVRSGKICNLADLEESSSSFNKPVCFHVFLGIYAYATLKDDATISAEDLRKDLKAIVRQKIGSFAVPEVIQVILFGN